MATGFYADESESQNPAIFTLAGFIASPTGWKHFVPAWQDMLCHTGPYPVDSFHANALDKARSPYDGWTLQDRQALINRAIEILADTGICANLYAVGVYERCYRVLFHNVLGNTAFNGMDFIFDNKEKVKGRVKAHFDVAKAKADRDPKYAGSLNGCIFQDDRKVVPLQAADLLAFELRRRAWDRVKDPNTPTSCVSKTEKCVLNSKRELPAVSTEDVPLL